MNHYLFMALFLMPFWFEIRTALEWIFRPTTLEYVLSPFFCTRMTTCLFLTELRQALLSYQDYHMLLLTLAGIHLLAGVLLCVVPVWHTVSTVLSDPRSRYEDEGQGAAARSHIHAQSESAGPKQA